MSFIVRTIKRIAVSVAIRFLRAELQKLETHNREVAELRWAIYKLTLPEFAEWGMKKATITAGVEHMSVAQYFLHLIEPLNDEVEGIVKEIVEGLKP